MLSFMNLGNKKKRRKSKRGRSTTLAPTAARVAVAGGRNRNSSESFVSTEAILSIGVDDVEKKVAGFGLQHPYTAVPLAVPEWSSQRKEERSPALQLEFPHERFLSEFPRELLKSRNGSGSMSSMDDLMMSGRTKRGQVTGSKSSIDFSGGKMSNSPGSSRRAFHVPSPIDIPPPTNKVIVTQPSGKVVAPSSYHPPPEDDGDVDQLSTISGVSAARDVFAKSFSFISTPGTQYDVELLPPDQLPESDRNTDSPWMSSTSRSKERRRHRTMRQDSATLPRDFNWSERPSSTNANDDSRRSASSSRKSSIHSMWKRNALAEQELGDALREVLKGERATKGIQGEPQSVPLSARSRTQLVSPPPPPTLNTQVQKLDKSDQAALHRVSRVVEVPTPPASPEKHRRRPGMNMSKNSSSSLVPSIRTHAASASSSRPSTGRSGNAQVSSPPSSAGKSSKATTPTVVQTAVSTASSTSFPQKTGAMRASQSRSQAAVDVDLTEDEVHQMDLVSFLDDFQIVSPANTLSNKDLLNDAIARRRQPSSSSLKSTASRRHPKVRNDVTSSSSFLRLRSQQKPEDDYSPLTPQKREFSFGTAGKAKSIYDDIVLDISRERNAISTDEDKRKMLKSPSMPSIPKFSALPSATRLLQPEPAGFDIEKRRPSLPQLHTSNSVMRDEEESSASARSPDLLDMLIPNGNMVSPISSTRRKLGRKRSGSTPNPVNLMRRNTRKYRDGGLQFSPARDVDIYEEDAVQTPTTMIDHSQTFPETPRAFSPILTADFPVDAAYPSVSNVLSQVEQDLTESEAEMDCRRPPTPISPGSAEASYSPIEAAVEDPFKDGVDNVVHEEERIASPRRFSRPKSYPSTINSSPPISPIDLPPLPVLSPTASFPSLRNEPLTPAPNGVRRPLPILDTVITPPKPRAGLRPRLPFGPRKPNQHPLTQPPSISLLNSLYGSAPASLSGSPDALHLAHNSGSSSPAANTPTFKSTPIRWRGYSYDVAQWVLTSSELQTIVSRAIRESANPSTVRILTLDALDRELPGEVKLLEARKAEIETNYKVQVRKRRVLLHYLSSLSHTQPVSKGDLCASASRFAEEIADVTNTCDRLADELLDVSDQLGQIKKLKEVHSASAFNMALRKLYAKYTTQLEANHMLREEIADITEESQRAWKQAEELALDLDNISSPYVDGSDGQGGLVSPTVKSASRRSSRVSLGRRSTMRRSSRLSVRNSSASSLHVNLSSSVRSTFASDSIPPVPPLPEYRNSTLSSLASYDRPERERMVSGLPPSRAEDIRGMEREIFNMLDPKSVKTEPITPARRQSVIGTIYREDEMDAMRPPRPPHLRSASLPYLPFVASPCT